VNLAQVLNALSLSALLIMTSSGLALIFGLRGVMNFTHGSLYMLGAYIGSTLTAMAGYWVALVVVPLILAAAGIGLDYGVIRPLRRRSVIEVALITFGLALIIDQLVIKVYGPAARVVPAPSGLAGAVTVFGTTYPTYRLFVILVAVILCLALTLWLRFTRSGLMVRAASRDPVTARMMGVNTDRLGTRVVCLSTGVAGLAGAIAGPYVTANPGMGDSILITSLVIVTIGGLGSIAGAVGAAVLVGFTQVIGAVAVPAISSISPYLLLVIVLLVRPNGLGKGRGMTT
jgi:branched-chain amino acid transport system permease protein